jgi:hypothetical protein
LERWLFFLYFSRGSLSEVMAVIEMLLSPKGSLLSMLSRAGLEIKGAVDSASDF